MTMIEYTESLQNKSKHLYYTITKLFYLLGAPNYCYEDLTIPAFAKKIHDNIAKVTDVLTWIYLASLVGSFFTQNNLNEKQKVDRAIFALALPLYYSLVPTLTHYQEKVRHVAYNLVVKMKCIYNDAEVEQQMITQTKMYVFGFVFFSYATLFLYGVNGIIQVTKGATFVTLITAWPEVNDTSVAAGVVRVIAYLMFWICVTRIITGAFVVSVLMVIVVSHQYKILSSYFYTLNSIFEEENLNIEEKEKKYEEAFKIGIQMHSNTLRCTKLTQQICYSVYSVQLICCFTILFLLMMQLVVNPERSLSSNANIALFGACSLVATGCFWWTAGNTTVEASHLPTAMFHSGWHHCRGAASARLRPVVGFAMAQSQIPVELQCLGIMKLSYASYASLLKSSYSIFSVLY